MNDEIKHIHFVTGRLAEHALRRAIERLAQQIPFEFTIDVLPITVAALMTTKWVARHIQKIDQADYVLLPGYCEGDLELVQQRVGRPVERGPRDLRKLPEFFGNRDSQNDDYGDFDIEILAEINHAPRLSRQQLISQAQQLAADGADLIDIGCDPGGIWTGIADGISALRDLGLRVSVDSLNPIEIETAVRAGAELVLSVNASNREAAVDWGCEVVVIPDDFSAFTGMDETIDYLARHNVPVRLDPVIEPIGCGFASSLGRYLDVRRRYPDAEMMMGIGNLTELTDADSAGINLVLLGFCQEVGIRSVLTTQVINWARTSVRECYLARRLVHYAIQHRIPPKHREPQLVMLRDPEVRSYESDEFDRLASAIKDHNFRLFADNGQLHLVSSNLHLSDTDPFSLFEKLVATNPANLDQSHAFYLGFELAKATTALILSKEYRQDESLNWGHLTVPERSHRLSPRRTT